MVTAVTAKWHDDDYQSRFFWIKAAALRDPDTPHLIEVSYEADGPKAFDDVIIRYSPSRASCGPERISADYFQIKFHVVRSGRFGYENLILPEFISAQTTSLLERLKEAKLSSSGDAAYSGGVNGNSGRVNTDSGKMNRDSGPSAKSWYFPPEYAFT